MLIRISLIVAILAGLAVGFINFKYIKEKITTLQVDLSNTKQELAQTTDKLHKTEKELASTKTELANTKQALAAAQDAEHKAEVVADQKTKEAAKLTEDLAAAKKQLTDAQDELGAYHQSGLSAGQVATLAKDLKTTQDELVEAGIVIKGWRKKCDHLQAELDRYVNPDKPVYLPASLKGNVVVSDPKWDFVVLNVGDDQDVKENGELLVSRNGKLVAKVKITSVQKDRSIANVEPGWKLGDVMEGDVVVPAYPAS